MYQRRTSGWRRRLPVALSASAATLIVFGQTPVGATMRSVIAGIAPRAKTAGFATRAATAGNAQLLSGHPSSVAGAPGAVPVISGAAMLPASLIPVGPPGPRGPLGATGAQGPTGDQGPVGPTLGGAGVQFVTVKAANPAFHQSSTAIAQCPAGMFVASGGVYGTSAFYMVSASRPATNLTGWQGTFYTISNNASDAADREVFAVCADARVKIRLGGTIPISPNPIAHA